MNRFFGMFRGIAALEPAPRQVSFFDDAFAYWDHPMSSVQTWDVAALVRACESLKIERIVDVGCGTGRLAFALAGAYDTYIGLDSVQGPLSIFEELLRDSPATGIETRLMDVLHPFSLESLDRRTAFVMGNVTVNSFRDSDSLITLMRNLSKSFEGPKSVLLSVFSDEVIDKFPAFDHVVQPYTFRAPSGRNRIVWRGIHYIRSEHKLLHNVFLEGGITGEEWPGVLGNHIERVWTESAVKAVLEAAGHRCTRADTMYVADGGAKGWPVRLMHVTLDTR
ncbi:class I SAM-dependent methyltransferase [Streptomyces sp. NBC_00094]|uniref:class I SAM-dependent methyltransferase n=1 Tax=Streptomyces sp. NBC_00094 TaxID=2903620 RepID=UPI0022596E0E|nr:class I SAM-dependent methyltransferase [Streptomyces sp. NBC_00094]MCX5395095.1 methyltransferase domain-containing protein [Streptomyces sp. NBC_00094]